MIKMMEFKKGDIVKIIDPIKYENRLKTNDLLFIKYIGMTKFFCGFCRDLCRGITLEDLNGKEICNCCGKRAVRATERETLLFYIHGQKALQVEENDKEI